MGIKIVRSTLKFTNKRDIFELLSLTLFILMHPRVNIHKVHHLKALIGYYKVFTKGMSKLP